MFNKVLIVVFVMAFVIVFTHTAKAQVVPDGLIAYWSFDDIDGDTVNDGAGDFNGEMIDVNVVKGVIGDGLEFDGTGYVDIGEEVGELGAEDFSVTFWIKTGEVGIAILSKGGGAGWDSNEKEIYVANSATSEGPNTGPVEMVGWGVDWIRGSEPVNDDEWHHVAVTWEFAASDGHIYVDGVEGTFQVGYNGGADNAGNTVRIGFHESGHSATNFVGLMDDVRIYQRTLEPDEVVEVMEEDAAVDSAGKLATTWGMIK